MAKNSPPLWRPGPMPPTGNQLLNADLDLAFKATFDNLAGLQAQSVQGAVNGLAIASGVATVTGSQKGIASGLSAISNVVVALAGSTPVFEIVTCQPTPNNTSGGFDVFIWQATTTGNVTPIPSTAARKVQWIAVGTL